MKIEQINMSKRKLKARIKELEKQLFLVTDEQLAMHRTYDGIIEQYKSAIKIILNSKEENKVKPLPILSEKHLNPTYGKEK